MKGRCTTQRTTNQVYAPACDSNSKCTLERDRARGEVAQSDQRRTVTTEDNSAMVAPTYFDSVGPFSMCARKAETVRHESTTSPAQWHGGKLAAAW